MHSTPPSARKPRRVPAWLLSNERNAAANLIVAYWDKVNDGSDDAKLLRMPAATMGLTVGLRAVSS